MNLKSIFFALSLSVSPLVALPSDLNYSGREAQIVKESARLAQMIEAEKAAATERSARSPANYPVYVAPSSSSNSGEMPGIIVAMWIDLFLMTLAVFSLIPYIFYCTIHTTGSSSKD